MSFSNQHLSVPSLFEGSIHPERLISGNKHWAQKHDTSYLIGYHFEKTLHLYLYNLNVVENLLLFLSNMFVINIDTYYSDKI